MSYYIVSRSFGRIMAMLLGLALACRPEAGDGIAKLPGHSLPMGTVPHGQGLLHAERYCAHCHGLALSGGEQLEPSCYACHGKNWRDEPGAPSVAPARHSVDLGGWLHDPGYANPTAVCAECHGAELNGDRERGTPACLLCHGALWR